jgi:hypothetical protein
MDIDNPYWWQPAIKHLKFLPEAGAVYAHRRAELECEVSGHGGRVRASLTRYRDRRLYTLSRIPAVTTAFARCLAQVESVAEWGGCDSVNLARLGPSHVPIPVPPTTFDVTFSRSVAATLLSVSTLRPLHEGIRAALSIARLSRKARPFRTVWVGGRPVIVGHNRRTCEALAGIAHEVGHYLVDSGILTGQLPPDEVVSEAVAHFLEEETVVEFLRSCGSTSAIRPWRAYQRTVDRLNLLAFLSEARRVLRTPLHSRESVTWATDAEVLRESMFVLPGYQLVYALASVLRRSWRQRAAGRPPLHAWIQRYAVSSR